MLFIMAEKDEIVPFKHMMDLMENAESSEAKDFIVIKNGMHNDSW